jgi:hypothetical protein
VSEWTKWTDKRPDDQKLSYRWRVSARIILGMMLRPEWTGNMRLVGMGYGEPEWWPPFSNWDGYSRTVDPSLEWRLASEGEGENNILWGGLELLPCPFTGKPPQVTYCGRWIGAPPYLAESLSIESYLVRSSGWRNASGMAEAWNVRPASLSPAARRAPPQPQLPTEWSDESRDLCALAADRVSASLESVTSKCERKPRRSRRG